MREKKAIKRNNERVGMESSGGRRGGGKDAGTPPAMPSTLSPRAHPVATERAPRASEAAAATGRVGPEWSADAARVREWLGGGDHWQDEAHRRDLADTVVPPALAEDAMVAPEVDAMHVEAPPPSSGKHARLRPGRRESRPARRQGER